mmetsp:Transcript_5045/g.10017  ORF Transcript_5045/g.10017 Transcript_5045/m.10017 type:complete len:279 (-) Transcript_5045:862-1698(-)
MQGTPAVHGVWQNLLDRCASHRDDDTRRRCLDPRRCCRACRTCMVLLQTRHSTNFSPLPGDIRKCLSSWSKCFAKCCSTLSSVSSRCRCGLGHSPHSNSSAVMNRQPPKLIALTMPPICTLAGVSCSREPQTKQYAISPSHLRHTLQLHLLASLPVPTRSCISQSVSGMLCRGSRGGVSSPWVGRVPCRQKRLWTHTGGDFIGLSLAAATCRPLAAGSFFRGGGFVWNLLVFSSSGLAKGLSLLRFDSPLRLRGAAAADVETFAALNKSTRREVTDGE